MPKKLEKKFRRKVKAGQIQALGLSELKRILEYLDMDKSEKGLRDRALIYFAFTTGLRAAEIASLKYKILYLHPFI